MLLTAKKKYRLDMSKSVVVGDNVTDIQAGHKAGVGSLFLFNNGVPDSICKQIDFRHVNDLRAVAASLISG